MPELAERPSESATTSAAETHPPRPSDTATRDSPGAAINHDGAPLLDTRYDVFISYAHEDDEIASPLVRALRDLGLNPWYDRSEMKIGDDLPTKLARGISLTNVSAVILSHAFFKSSWTKFELNGLLTRRAAGEQVALPIWHGITHDELLAYNPPLAGIVALNTARASPQEIAKEIHSVVVESRRNGS